MGRTLSLLTSSPVMAVAALLGAWGGLAAAASSSSVFVSVNAGGNSLQIKPARIHLLSNENLYGLRWSAWGGSVARARGEHHGNSPSPGHRANNPVKVELKGERSCGGKLVYTTVIVRFVAGTPYAGEAHIEALPYGCPHQ